MSSRKSKNEEKDPAWVATTVRLVKQRNKRLADRVRKILLATERVEMPIPAVSKMGMGIQLWWSIDDRELEIVLIEEDQNLFSYTKSVIGEDAVEKADVPGRGATSEIRDLVWWIEPPQEPYQGAVV